MGVKESIWIQFHTLAFLLPINHGGNNRRCYIQTVGFHMKTWISKNGDEYVVVFTGMRHIRKDSESVKGFCAYT